MQHLNDGTVHLIKLDRGEKIIESILNYAKEKNLKSGFFTGIGATMACEIGWFDPEKKEYVNTSVDENCELLGLVGNIGLFEGNPIAHAHIMLGKSDYSVIGGHLVEGTIGVTCEIYLHITGFEVQRKIGAFGLKLIEV